MRYDAQDITLDRNMKYACNNFRLFSKCIINIQLTGTDSSPEQT